jgi:hypothetical protein
LSPVRELAVWSGIALAEMKQEERNCGVWAVDVRNGVRLGGCSNATSEPVS